MKKRKKSKKHLSSKNLFSLLFGFFKENPNKRFNYKQISKALRIKEKGVKIQMIEVLKNMVSSGVLKEAQRGSYQLVKKTTKIITKIKNTSSRGVFANVDEGFEVFIPTKDSLFSLTGDEVEILLYTKKKNQYEGEVVSVIKRKKEEFVGVIDATPSGCFLISDDKKTTFDVFLPPKSVKQTFLNKKVLVKVESWSNKFKNPFGKVVRVIGDVQKHDVQINSILYDYGFSPVFPKKVENEAKKISEKISEEEINKRLDVRGVATFTIDPENAKDFDDALSVRKKKNGNWEVGVHIADVSHYVLSGGIIDSVAEERATSIYLVDRVIPMLPEALSNNICSLKPNVDRLAYSVFFEMTEKAVLVDYKIAKTIIHSKQRFTYQQAQNVINNNEGVFVVELLLLDRFSKILRKKRKENGSINFESSEVKFVLDKEKNPVDVYFKECLATNHLIEEFMLLTNKTVAKHVGFPKKTAKPFIYRVHDSPDEEKIISLNNIVKKFGYSIDNKNPKILSKSLNRILESVKGTQEQHLVETLTVRAMAKAVYTTNNIGHYGLSFDYYSHFTSPIRRYTDLVVHRLLSKYFNKKIKVKRLDLEKICSHCSESEKTASSAERDSIKLMQVKYLKNKIGEFFEGVISGVAEWGLYVELLANKCEGLVRIGSIKDDHYVYDEKKFALIGFRSKTCYQIGQKVKIKVQGVDLKRNQIAFVLV